MRGDLASSPCPPCRRGMQLQGAGMYICECANVRVGTRRPACTHPSTAARPVAVAGGAWACTAPAAHCTILQPGLALT